MKRLNATDELWMPIADSGAAEQIVRRLGEALGSGVLRAGERLPSEADLSKRFFVSVMTVRKALAVLRSEGYIVTRQGREGGSYVAPEIEDRIAAIAAHKTFTPEQLRELTDWRCAISGEVAALAATRHAPSEITLLEAQIREIDANLSSTTSFRITDAQFHITLAEVSRSRRLMVAETEIQQELTRIIAPLPGGGLVRSNSHQQHSAILRPIKGGDPERARLKMIQHVESTFDWLIGLNLGSAKPVKAAGH